MKINLVTCILLISIVVTSCKKDRKKVIPERMLVPWYPGWLMPGHNTFAPTYPAYANVWGVLVANKMTMRLTDTAEVEKNYFINSESASFLSASGKNVNYSNAGSVSLNSNSIGFDANYGIYRVYDTVGAWHEGTSNNWTIAGSTDVSPFTADIDGTMPQFTGSLPSTISWSTDLSIVFNASNVANADSVHFIVYNYGYMQTSNVVSGRGGTAIINAVRLKALKSMMGDYKYTLPHNSISPKTDSSVFSGGLIMVVLFNHTTKTVGGKDFVFVRQTEIVQTVKVGD